MTSRLTISETFHRIERQGDFTADEARIVCLRVAAELGIPLEDVVEVMREEFAGGAN